MGSVLLPPPPTALGAAADNGRGAALECQGGRDCCADSVAIALRCLGMWTSTDAVRDAVRDAQAARVAAYPVGTMLDSDPDIRDADAFLRLRGVERRNRGDLIRAPHRLFRERAGVFVSGHVSSTAATSR